MSTSSPRTPNCSACGATLKPVFAEVDPAGYQYDNAMWIGLFGGYGMFIDSVESGPSIIPGPPDITLVICHECAHSLCETHPWLANAISPLASHAHSHDADWSGHEGWDLPHKTIPAS